MLRLLLGNFGMSILLSACQSDERQSLRIFAASSLTDVMADLVSAFEAKHPDVKIELSTGGSHILRTQLENGAAAELFASASPDDVHALVERGLCEEPQALAGGELVIYVSSAAQIHSFSDIAQLESWVVGSPDSPIGRYTADFLSKLDEQTAQHIRHRTLSYEHNVRLIRAKIDLAAADAGIVYASDLQGRAEAQLISIPDQLQPEISYVLSRCQKTSHSAAELFQQFVMQDGKAILAQHRFKP